MSNRKVLDYHNPDPPQRGLPDWAWAVILYPVLAVVAFVVALALVFSFAALVNGW